MNIEANIPRGKISSSREFAIPFLTRSSSHTAQCKCPEPGNTYPFSPPSMPTSSPNSKDVQDPAGYFPSTSGLKTEFDRMSLSSSSENENEKPTKDKEDDNLSSSPTAAESEESGDHHASPPSSNYARLVAYGLVGMTIDYNGDVLDSAKKSCGKASGDITEMVGQKVGEDGLIRNTAGGVVGQVARNYGLEEAVSAMMEAQKHMGGGTSKENSSNAYTDEKKRTRSAGSQEKNKELPNIWQGTVGDAAPGNDIHLNVQSTKEGISMSIRIPTLFMKEQHRLFEESEKNTKKSQAQ